MVGSPSVTGLECPQATKEPCGDGSYTPPQCLCKIWFYEKWLNLRAPHLETVKDRSCPSGGLSVKERSIGRCWSKGDVGLADPFLKISSHRHNHICTDVEVEKFRLGVGSESWPSDICTWGCNVKVIQRVCTTIQVCGFVCTYSKPSSETASIFSDRNSRVFPQATISGEQDLISRSGRREWAATIFKWPV